MRTHILFVLLSTVLVAIGGSLDCAASEPRERSQSNKATSTHNWVVTITPSQAMQLAPDDAKALLIARAELESQAKARDLPRPDILSLHVTREKNGWSVYVQYIAFWEGGRPYSAPGDFSVVFVGLDGQVKRITGGA